MNRSNFVKEKGYQIDNFIEFFDIQDSELAECKELKKLMETTNKTSIEISRQNTLKTKFRNKIPSAEDFNYFCDCLKNMQTFIKTEVEGYVLTKQSEINNHFISTRDDMSSFANVKKNEVTSFINTKESEITNTTQYNLKLINQAQDQLLELDSRQKWWVQWWYAKSIGQAEYNIFVDGVETNLTSDAILNINKEAILVYVNGTQQKPSDYEIKNDGLYRTLVLKGSGVARIQVGTEIMIRYCKNMGKLYFDHAHTHGLGGKDPMTIDYNQFNVETQNKLALQNTINTKNINVLPQNTRTPVSILAEYPMGITTMNSTDAVWKEALGLPGFLCVQVNTNYATERYGVQHIIVFDASDGILIGEYRRIYCNGWTKFYKIVTEDNNQLKTSNKTMTGAINELVSTKQNQLIISSSINSTSTTDIANSYAVKQTMDRANEAFTYASNGKELISNAITGKGISASSTDTFSVLASKIGNISTGKKFATGNGMLKAINFTGTEDNSIVLPSQITLCTQNLDFTPKYVFIKLSDVLRCHADTHLSGGQNVAENQIDIDRLLNNVDNLINFNDHNATFGGHDKIYAQVKIITLVNSFKIDIINIDHAGSSGSVFQVGDWNWSDVGFTYYAIE